MTNPNDFIDNVIAELDRHPNPRAFLAQWVRVSIAAATAMAVLKELALQEPTFDSELALALVASYESECDPRQASKAPPDTMSIECPLCGDMGERSRSQ